jgi:probable rRNA maturation factor
MKHKTAPVTKITVRNLRCAVRVDLVDLERFVRKAAALCLRLPSKKQTDLQALGEVSILIISDRRMASMHRRFMNEAGPTDVITFQHGEIFISAETAQGNARRFRNKLNRELRLYVLHGLLHLHGFDDRDPVTARKMQAVQERVLARAGGLN